MSIKFKASKETLNKLSPICQICDLSDYGCGSFKQNKISCKKIQHRIGMQGIAVIPNNASS